jgi:hypothetical protein
MPDTKPFWGVMGRTCVSASAGSAGLNTMRASARPARPSADPASRVTAADRAKSRMDASLPEPAQERAGDRQLIDFRGRAPILRATEPLAK